MPGRTNWTQAMLERLQELHNQGNTDREVSNILFLEFDAPRNMGAVIAELKMLKTGNALLPALPYLANTMTRSEGKSMECGHGKPCQGVLCTGYGCQCYYQRAFSRICEA